MTWFPLYLQVGEAGELAGHPIVCEVCVCCELDRGMRDEMCCELRTMNVMCLNCVVCW
ncbi:hypothetical protein LINPERHAP1_LOCUS303 [Linum perenne]